jgi:hypothetical protein
MRFRKRLREQLWSRIMFTFWNANFCLSRNLCGLALLYNHQTLFWQMGSDEYIPAN